MRAIYTAWMLPPMYLTNGLEGEHNWFTVDTIACCSFSSEADAVCLSFTALDARDRVLVHPSTQLWDAL